MYKKIAVVRLEVQRLFLGLCHHDPAQRRGLPVFVALLTGFDMLFVRAATRVLGTTASLTAFAPGFRSQFMIFRKATLVRRHAPAALAASF